MTDCWASSQGTTYPADETVPGAKFRQVKRATILVDSRDRDYSRFPTPSEYVVTLPQVFHNVSNAVLMSAELPATYYVFAADRGTTSLDVSVGGVKRTVAIPDGNYTFTTMASALKSSLEAAFAGSTFTVTFNAVTSKCQIAVSPSAAIEVDCTRATKPTGWGLGYYLGFAKGVVTSGTGSVVGAGVANMNPETYMVIHIEELNNVSHAAIYGEGGHNRKAFAKVPMCHPTFQYSFYDKQLMCNEQRPPLSKLDRLSISIRFHDGTLVDFHGAEHSLTIELTCTLTR